MPEVMMNGVLDEELKHYYHICFFTDNEGPALDNPDRYIFVPKPVCRIIDYRTVTILDWYVRKKKMYRYMRGRRLYKKTEAPNRKSANRRMNALPTGWKRTKQKSAREWFRYGKRAQ